MTIDSAGYRIARLLIEFGEKSRVGEWPTSSSVHCHWCCHRFDGVPFGTPLRYTEGRFHVTGCFCSLNCAAAHNFACKVSTDEMYERYALLNLLHERVYDAPPPQRRVRPAPDRCTLAAFGGHLSIDDFRASSVVAHPKVLTISHPPMIALQQHVVEFNDRDLRSENRFVPLDNDRVNKYQEKIKLRRTKPVAAYKNTLDGMMKVRTSS